MKFVKNICFGLLLLPVLANANDSYIEVDLMMITLEAKPSFFPGETFEADPTGLQVKGGKYITQNVAIEGIFAIGLSDDTVESSSLDAGLNNMFGLYGVASLPASPAFDVFAKAGFVSITYEDEDKDKVEGSGLSFGFGGTFKLSGSSSNGAIVVEYVIFPETEYDFDVWGADFPVDSNTLNIGFRNNF